MIPKNKKRITITLSEHTYELLEQHCKITNKKKSKIADRAIYDYIARESYVERL